MPLVSSYGGLPIFGASSRFVTIDNPRVEQVQRMFGSSYLARVDGGMRGRFTFVNGLITAVDGLALASIRSQASSLNDGGARLLVDPLGAEWANVQLEMWMLTGRIRSSSTGVYSAFASRLFHLA